MHGDHRATERPQSRDGGAAQHAFRTATAADADEIAALVDAAYRHYVQRIGGLPGPMQADYREVISQCAVTVAVTPESIAGVIVLAVTPEGFAVENVAVHPARQKLGLGRRLLSFAESEATRAGFDSLYLYTHELMTENLALYQSLGYVEYERRALPGFSLVFLRKQL